MTRGALDWSEEMLALFEIPRSRVPDLRSSAERVGLATCPTSAWPPPCWTAFPISGVLVISRRRCSARPCFESGMAKVTYGTGSFVPGQRRRGASGAAGTGSPSASPWEPARPRPPEGIPGWRTPSKGRPSSSGARHPVAARRASGIIDSAAEAGPLAESVPDSGGVTLRPCAHRVGQPLVGPRRPAGILTGLNPGAPAGAPESFRACVEAMAFQVRDMTDAMGAASAYPPVRAAG